MKMKITLPTYEMQLPETAVQFCARLP